MKADSQKEIDRLKSELTAAKEAPVVLESPKRKMRRKQTTSFAEENKREGSKAVREDIDGLKAEFVNLKDTLNKVHSEAGKKQVSNSSAPELVEIRR